MSGDSFINLCSGAQSLCFLQMPGFCSGAGVVQSEFTGKVHVLFMNNFSRFYFLLDRVCHYVISTAGISF